MKINTYINLSVWLPYKENPIIFWPIPLLYASKLQVVWFRLTILSNDAFFIFLLHPQCCISNIYLPSSFKLSFCAKFWWIMSINRIEWNKVIACILSIKTTCKCTTYWICFVLNYFHLSSFSLSILWWHYFNHCEPKNALHTFLPGIDYTA